MMKLIIATRNAHKVGEIRAILGGNFECWSLNEMPDAPEVVEDALTFAGNATKKAIDLAKWVARQDELVQRLRRNDSESFVLADDSGFEVYCLGRRPRGASARSSA